MMFGKYMVFALAMAGMGASALPASAQSVPPQSSPGAILNYWEFGPGYFFPGPTWNYGPVWKDYVKQPNDPNVVQGVGSVVPPPSTAHGVIKTPSGHVYIGSPL